MQAGEAPTQANAQRLIARLMRKAQLQPALADACICEAAEIEVLLQLGKLPPGDPTMLQAIDFAPAKHRTMILEFEHQATMLENSRWAKLYQALSGRKPSSGPHNAKFQGPHGQWLFLSTAGGLRQGLTPRRSVTVPPAKIEALLAAYGRPSTRPTASLADLKELF